LELEKLKDFLCIAWRDEAKNFSNQKIHGLQENPTPSKPMASQPCANSDVPTVVFFVT